LLSFLWIIFKVSDTHSHWESWISFKFWNDRLAQQQQCWYQSINAV